jgi:hypothetical protein
MTDQQPTPKVATVTRLHLMLAYGARLTAEARITPHGSTFLSVDTPEQGADIAVSGTRADVERVVEDMVRALAALPEPEQAPGQPTPTIQALAATLEQLRAQAEAQRFLREHPVDAAAEAQDEQGGEGVVGDQQQ